MVGNRKSRFRFWNSARRKRLVARLARSPWVMSALGAVIAAYLRLVRATSRLVAEPANPVDVVDRNAPLIAVGWHGQFVLLPALTVYRIKFDSLVSRNTDGEIVAQVIRRFGHTPHRGSGGGDPSQMHEKGAVVAFRGLVEALRAGRSVFISADHRRDMTRQVSGGVLALARLTGRPIIPVAVASSRAIVLSTWDKTTINLPFSRVSIVAGEPIWVPEDVDDAATENLRRTVAAGLDTVVARAETLARGR